MDRDSGRSRPFLGRQETNASLATPSPYEDQPVERTAAPHRNPFTDRADSAASQRSLNEPVNPFASPYASRAPSTFDLGSAVGSGRFDEKLHRYFHTRRVKKEDIEQPWLNKKDPKEKWVTILPLIGIFVGLAISGFLVYDGLSSVVKHKYCELLMEDFSRGLDPKIWQQEVQVGGFGNNEFEQTTADGTNVYIENGHLIIKATLQDANKIESDTTIDLIADGTCTSDHPSDCFAQTNTTTGNATIVPPTKSGRINTKPGAQMRYGRVEVTAKMPEGDWLWPAIWMYPADSAYGAWPLSGEIDIMESRGNNHTYPQGGNNIASSALHWGPNPANDAFWRTNVKRPALHTTYSAGFNVFGLEWSQKYIFTYINSRLLQVLYTNFDQPMWQRGNFPSISSNGTRLQDPWTETGHYNAPFDQKFFLILNVAVGGTNGWFQDNVAGKPWLDGSPNARKDFWQAKDQWLPTWKSPQMEVSKVQMWRQCDPGDL